MNWRSENRTDNRNRRICNSVAWMCNESEEAILRDIVIQALEGELERKVDKAIVSKKNDRGFTVDFKVLEPKQIASHSVKKGKQSSLEFKIGNLSELKQDLIEEVSQVSIPSHNGILILVSSSLSRSAFQETQVWRGLSDVIDSDDWLEVSNSKFQHSLKEGGDRQLRQKSFSQSNRPSQFSVFSKSKTSTTSNPKTNRDSRENSREINKPSKNTFWKFIVVFILLVSLTGNAFLFYKWQDAKKYQEQNYNLKKENEQLQQANLEMEKQIKKSREIPYNLNQNRAEKEKKLQEVN